MFKNKTGALLSQAKIEKKIQKLYPTQERLRTIDHTLTNLLTPSLKMHDFFLWAR